MVQKSKGKSRNTKEARLKRIDANLKAFYIRDEIEKRISSLSETIASLNSVNQPNEHMIAVHRRNELEELDRWVKEEIVNKSSIGTREALKIWDILKYGKHGEVYEAKSTIGNWNGTQVQYIETEHSTHLIYYKIPKVANSSIYAGSIVNIVGAVMGADWEYIGKHDRAVLPSRYRLLMVCIDLKRIVSGITDKTSAISYSPLFMEKTKLGVSETIEYIVTKIKENPADYLTQANNKQQEEEVAYLREELIIMRDFISNMTDDELVERIESLYSLIFYFYHKWFGIEEWESRMELMLPEQDMLSLATDVLNSYKVNSKGDELYEI